MREVVAAEVNKFTPSKAQEHSRGTMTFQGESPQLLEQSRVDFEEQLALIPEEQKESVRKAEEHCPEQLDDKFKLLFLRSETFNAKVRT